MIWHLSLFVSFPFTFYFYFVPFLRGLRRFPAAPTWPCFGKGKARGSDKWWKALGFMAAESMQPPLLEARTYLVVGRIRHKATCDDV